MTKTEKKIITITAIMGFVYGSIFYPFYNEFLEFGQTLSGKIPIYEYNKFYLERDVAPSILFLISKYLSILFENIKLGNLLISGIISTISFTSVYLFSLKFFPNGMFNFLIPLGFTSIFFPNYFLYPLWFPNYFFTWGQISFFIFLASISFPYKNLLQKLIFLTIITLCHPVYGAIATLFFLFEDYHLKIIKLKKVAILLVVFLISLIGVTSSVFKVFLNKDKIIISKNEIMNEHVVIKNSEKFNLKNNSLEKDILQKASKTNLGNYHSPLYTGKPDEFIKKLTFFFIFLIPFFFIQKYNLNFSKKVKILNLFLGSILILCISISILSIFLPKHGIIGSLLGLIDRAAPNRVLNCYFLIFLFVVLNKIDIKLLREKNIFQIIKTIFLFIFILPIPIYILPNFFYKLYPSIIELTLISLIILLIVNKLINVFFKNNLKETFVIISEKILNTLLNYKLVSQFLLISMIGIGSVFVRYVDNNIGPKYFVLLNENEDFLKKIYNFSNNLSNKNSKAILLSYNVHGIRGMNVQQFTNRQYLLPSPSLPKYNFGNELRSIGCYEKSKNIRWDNFKSQIRNCFENKSKKEWEVILKKYNFIGVLVPASYKLKLKNKFTDNIFTLYY